MKTANSQKARLEQTKHQRMLVERAFVIAERLSAVASGLSRLLGDDRFVRVLESEALNTLPALLTESHLSEGRTSGTVDRIKVVSRCVEHVEIARLRLGQDVTETTRRSSSFRQLNRSLRAVGLVMPLVVIPSPGNLLKVLDGNKRLDVLLRLNVGSVDCIVTTEEEARRNRRFHYLSPLDEHAMIRRALMRFSTLQIAKALRFKIETVCRKRDLVEGICEEAIALLQQENVASLAFAALQQMKPTRQVEAAELMIASQNFSGKFAQSLVCRSGPDKLAGQTKSYNRVNISSVQSAEMINDTDCLLRNARTVERSYGTDALKLTVCVRYIERLLANERVRAFVEANYPDMFRELDNLTVAVSAERNRRSMPKLRPALTAIRLGSRSRKERLRRESA